MNSIGTFEVLDSRGERVSMEQYKGRVLLIVNVASQCGFTPQYEGLQQLHDAYSERGLTVLGFPCDQFGHQEPGTNEEIQQFCSTKFSVQFPVLSKVEVNGAGADPLFVWLKAGAKGLLGTEAIKWNFTKFLVAPDGKTITRFAPQTTPDSLRKPIEALLP